MLFRIDNLVVNLQSWHMSTDQDNRNPPDDSPGIVIMPPKVFLALLLVGIALEFLISGNSFCPPILALVAGIAITALGFAFMMWGHERFHASEINVKTNLPTSKLVMRGAYRVSRNPMYVGFVAMLAGIGVAAASVWICAMVIPFFLYFQLYVIPREESYLLRRFGPAYVDYKKKVGRWL